jgi:phosphate transport system ATP-binding protein
MSSHDTHAVRSGAKQELTRRGPEPQGAVPMSMPSPPMTTPTVKAAVKDFSFSYGDVQVLKHLHMTFADKQVTALIGPSGCGKTTLLRCFNRLHDLYPGIRYTGEIFLYPDGVNIVAPQVDPLEMRLRISMVFQKPNPFPKSIFENIAYGLRLRGLKKRKRLAERVETALRDAALWNEVKDRLHTPALTLSGGQQQRLCIARSLAIQPEILLCDEPTSALDPLATSAIEELLCALKQQVTVIIVTHNMQQAARVSDFTGFLYLGELVEVDRTVQIFENPSNKLTQDYITGRFG